MRIVGEYLAKAATFEALSTFESNPTIKMHYGEQASYYRRLAQERQWMLAKQTMADRRLPAALGST
jgi:hypothetical protein